MVDQRQSATEYTRLAEIREFAGRVDQAAGFSANFEFVTRMVKLGGNGPIMANALGRFGAPVTYLGNLGTTNLHPVFTEFAAGCARVVSIAEPGFTDAIEFEDGKLMCGKHESLKDVHWASITRHVPLPELTELFAGSTFIALVNWTMILHMTAILRSVLREVVPQLSPAADGAKRWMFFDLCDPAKRTREDIAELLEMLMEFQAHFRVVLGLNFQESRQIGAVLGLGDPGETPAAVAAHATRIEDRLAAGDRGHSSNPLCRGRGRHGRRFGGRALHAEPGHHDGCRGSFQLRFLPGAAARRRLGGKPATRRGDQRLLRAAGQEPDGG